MRRLEPGSFRLQSRRLNHWSCVWCESGPGLLVAMPDNNKQQLEFAE